MGCPKLEVVARINLQIELLRPMNRIAFRQANSSIYWLIAVLTLTSLAGLSGCRGSGYCLAVREPATPTANEFLESDSIYVSKSSPAADCWWAAFNDPQLDLLVQLVQDQNLSIKTSLARIDEAAHLSNAAGLKKLQLRPPAGALPGMSAFCLANAQLSGRKASHQHAVNELITAAVKLYINIRATDQRLGLVHENVVLQEHNLELANERLEQGRTSKFDIAMINSELETIRSAIPQLELGRRKYSNGLCVIAGKLSGELDYLIDSPGGLPAVSVPISVDDSQGLLGNRADLTAAVVKYQATFCKSESPDLLTRLLQRFNPELLAEVELARQAESNQALFDYQNKTLLAYSQVEDWIFEFIKKNEQLEIENRIVSANKDAVELAEAAFEAGRLDLTKVLGLQTKWNLSKDKVVETQRDIALAFAMANQALGNANRCNCKGAGEPLNCHQIEEIQYRTVPVDDQKTSVEVGRPAFEESESLE